MHCFPFFGRWLLNAFLLVAVRGWGQGVPAPLGQALHHYQPRPQDKRERRMALGHRGTIQLPPAGTHRRTGTLDSDRGEIELPSLLIHYDIGQMAGMHVSPYNRGGGRHPGGDPVPFSAYETRVAGPLQATLGLRPGPGSSQVVATLQPRGADPATDDFPSNFWADVRTEAELLLFLAIVFSYRSVAKP